MRNFENNYKINKCSNKMKQNNKIKKSRIIFKIKFKMLNKN